MTGKNKTITNHSHLAEIAKLFLKLGVIGFGGPAAHIALMQQEVVTRLYKKINSAYIILGGAIAGYLLNLF